MRQGDEDPMQRGAISLRAMGRRHDVQVHKPSGAVHVSTHTAPIYVIIMFILFNCSGEGPSGIHSIKLLRHFYTVVLRYMCTRVQENSSTRSVSTQAGTVREIQETLIRRSSCY